MVSCIIRDIVNSFNPTYCNDLKGLILELTRQALVGGGELIKVFSHTFCNRQMRTVLQQDGSSRTNRNLSHTAAIERQVKKVTLGVEKA